MAACNVNQLLKETYTEATTTPADRGTCFSVYLQGVADTAKLLDKAVRVTPTAPDAVVQAYVSLHRDTQKRGET